VNDQRRKVCLDISDAYSGLSWKPIINIREGIKKTVDWWEAR